MSNSEVKAKITSSDPSVDTRIIQYKIASEAAKSDKPKKSENK